MMQKMVVRVCVVLIALGCAKDAEQLENPVLAEVGDRRITASQLIDFEQRLPAQLKTKKSGLDGYRDYLQTIHRQGDLPPRSGQKGTRRGAGSGGEAAKRKSRTGVAAVV